MTPSAVGEGTAPAGHRLFARYAHAPNALGYCGPASSDAVRAVACGSPAQVDIAGVARRFSGAWPYQQILADMTGVGDPLAEEVVRGYWTGNSLTKRVDRVAFGRALLERITPQVAAYWAHLTDDLLGEAAPTHAFHVLSVYPWSRLLGAGPGPLHVLDSCRIAWATVRAVEPEALVVEGPVLAYDEGVLTLTAPVERRVGYRVGGETFVDGFAVGDRAAVHWDFACDRLTDEQAEALAAETAWQLAAVAPRLLAAHRGSPAVPKG